MSEPPPATAARCGLYCGVCRLHSATREGDLRLLARLATVYARRLGGTARLSADDLQCDGCLSERRSFFCRTCSIRECTQGRELPGCHRCTDFPCALIEAFPIPVGARVIMRAVPYRRVHGTAAWIWAEEVRYRCPDCGAGTYRGAEWCPHCQARISLDD